MGYNFYYIAEGKLYEYKDGKENGISSVVLNSYLEKVKDSAKRNEWKHNGKGAAFTETYDPSVNPESAVNAVFSRISAVGEHDGDILYSLEIDRTNGIYRKYKDNPTSEGIVLCSFENKYYDFDAKKDKLAVSVYFAGESNIGVYDINTKNLTTYTEGHTIDRAPVFSKQNESLIYFTSTGLPNEDPEAPKSEAPKSYGQMVSEIYDNTATTLRGPTSVCSIDTERGELTEILSDREYDYTSPYSSCDGSLYYIKKPYSLGAAPNPLGILGDILLFPFRILRALFSFLNVFSATYSGKTLTKGKNTKYKDEKKTFIDGNLINAEKELQENARKGEKFPGIIPRSWELHKLDKYGADTLIKKGVASYKVIEESGEIIYSNGSSIVALSSDGKEEKLSSADKVSYIR